jgi:hypothetical protein
MRSLLALCLLAAVAADPAAAQLVLPGAVPPTPAGAKEHPPGSPARPGKAQAAPFKPAPGDATLIGKPLWLNGRASQVSFARKDKDLVATALSLVGDSLAQPGEECRVEVKPPEPMPLQSLGSPVGLLRYGLDVPACRITFDVLEGAILVPKDTPVCVFAESRCRFNPAGLWGPLPSEIGPDRVKELERARAAAYAAEQADFRALVAHAPDKGEVKKLAAQQAAFSSEREEACRSYAGESVHGFCATRFTEARVAALQALLGQAPAPVPAKKKLRRRPARAAEPTAASPE